MPATPPTTVVETASFAAHAARLLSEAEREALIDMIAYDPECGDVLVGGRDKRGGIRVICCSRDERIPVFLLAPSAKSDRANPSRAEIAELGEAAKAIAKNYGA